MSEPDRPSTNNPRFEASEGQHTPPSPEEGPSNVTETISNPIPVGSVKQKEIKLADPPQYYGNNLHEYNTFIRALERRYELNPSQYTTDRIKVVYASSWLRKTIETTWATKEKELKRMGQSYSWEEFKEFLHNDLEDVRNRGFAAAIRFENLKQQPGQAVQQFASKFDETYDDLATNMEQLRTQQFFAKLLPTIRDLVQNYQNPPTNRNELAALVARLEAVHKIHDKKDKKENKRQKERSPSNSNSNSNSNYQGKRGTKRTSDGSPTNSRRTTSRPKPGALTAAEKQRRQENNLCFVCADPGHMASECSKSTKKRRTNVTDSKGASLSARITEPDKQRE